MPDMAETLMRSPLVQLEHRAKMMPDGDKRVVADSLIEDAQKALFLAEYLRVRGGNHAGDGGHAKALKAAQAKVCKVRKAMGFTYPKSGLATVSF